MIQWKDKIFSGQVMKNRDDVLAVTICTVETFRDVTASMNGVTEVFQYTTLDDRESFLVYGPHLAKIVAPNVYYLEFSTKPPLNQRIEAELQEQSKAIDDLLVALLEV